MKAFHSKLLTLACLILAIISLASWQQKEEPKPTNLKILPKNISHEELDNVMDGFKAALGVKCGFCHAKSKTNEKKLDFASDENPHKDIARNMMKMTAKINKKYFELERGELKNKVSCISCHNGAEKPKN